MTISRFREGYLSIWVISAGRCGWEIWIGPGKEPKWVETVTLALSKCLHTPSWVRRTNATTVQLAKEYSKGLGCRLRRKPLCMKNQRVSHGNGELALPLKGGGVQESHSRSISLIFLICEVEITIKICSLHRVVFRGLHKNN